MEKLPQEIVCMIAEYAGQVWPLGSAKSLASGSGRPPSTFRRCAMISRSWQHAVEGILYRHVTIEDNTKTSIKEVKRELNANGGRWRYIRTIRYEWKTCPPKEYVLSSSYYSGSKQPKPGAPTFDSSPDFYAHMRQLLWVISRNTVCFSSILICLL